MDKEAINRQLEKIFSHDLFKSSRRSVSFLSYVCQRTIEGGEEQIKEYSIAVDAFGLDHDFDQQLTPRIRVEAKRLRDKLRRYYLTDGKEDELIIVLPKGTYIPEFKRKNEAPKTAAGGDSPEREKELILLYGDFLLVMELTKSPGVLFNGSDYLQMELLKLLYIRSVQFANQELDGMRRVKARISHSACDSPGGIEVILRDQKSDEIIASSVFSFDGEGDYPILSRTIFQMADYIISHCRKTQ